MNRIQVAPDSHILQELAVGRILSSRINEVMARPTTKRHTQYLALITRQIHGYGDTDPADAYRERELVPVALDAFEARGKTQLDRGYFYLHPEYTMLACAPDAIEEDKIGYTAHIRQTEESYESAVADNLNAQYMRTAQAAMAVTGLKVWVHLDYWQDSGTRKRRLFETAFLRNPLADELLLKMAWFYYHAVQCHLH